MTLEICPSCKNQDSIFLAHGMAVGLDGKPYGGRAEAFCNNMQCDQRYWYYPMTGRVTCRNVGLTYQEWRAQQQKPKIINLGNRITAAEVAQIRKKWAADAGVVLDVQTAVGPEAVNEVLAECPPPVPTPGTVEKGLGSLELPDLRQYLFEKWCMVRAFFVVFMPGFKRFSVCEEEETGLLPIGHDPSHQHCDCGTEEESDD